jgi:hypothetical protein
MSEVKGLKSWQEKPGAESKEPRAKIQKQTFMLSDLLIDLAKNKMNQLFDNVVRGGRR